MIKLSSMDRFCSSGVRCDYECGLGECFRQKVIDIRIEKKMAPFSIGDEVLSPDGDAMTVSNVFKSDIAPSGWIVSCRAPGDGISVIAAAGETLWHLFRWMR